MISKNPVVALVIGLTGLMFAACGSVPTPNTPTIVAATPSQTANPPPTATSVAAPQLAPTVTPDATDTDSITITVVVEKSMQSHRKTLGVSTSTSRSGQTGKTTTTTWHRIDDSYVDFPW